MTVSTGTSSHILAACSCSSFSFVKYSTNRTTFGTTRRCGGSARFLKTAIKAQQRATWLPGLDPPPYLDGTLAGDFGFDPLGLEVLHFGKVSESQKKEAMEQGVDCFSWEEFTSMGKLDDELPAKHKTDICTIMYTSGTTGEPKGVILSNATFMSEVLSVHQLLVETDKPATEEDTYFSFLPLVHIFDKIMETYCIYTGSSIGFWQGDIRYLIEDLLVLKPTIFCGVPRVYDRIYTGIMAKISTGGAVRKALFDFAYNYKLRNLENGIQQDKSAPLLDKLVFDKIKQGFGGRLLRVTGISDLPVWYEAGATKFGFASTRTLFIVQLLLMGFAETKRYMDITNPGSQAKEGSFFGLEAALEGLEPGYPGGPLLNPLGLAKDIRNAHELKLKEIKNGRLSMVAMLGIFMQANVTHVGPIDNLVRHLSNPWHETIIQTLVGRIDMIEELEKMANLSIPKDLASDEANKYLAEACTKFDIKCPPPQTTNVC